ncbi:hypothetical protein V8E36_007375 [Tilletia maclaganii]
MDLTRTRTMMGSSFSSSASSHLVVTCKSAVVPALRDVLKCYLSDGFVVRRKDTEVNTENAQVYDGEAGGLGSTSTPRSVTAAGPLAISLPPSSAAGSSAPTSSPPAPVTTAAPKASPSESARTAKAPPSPLDIEGAPTLEIYLRGEVDGCRGAICARPCGAVVAAPRGSDCKCTPAELLKGTGMVSQKSLILSIPISFLSLL